MKRSDIQTGQTYLWQSGTRRAQVVTVIAATVEEVKAQLDKDYKQVRDSWMKRGLYEIDVRRSVAIQRPDRSTTSYVPLNQIKRPISPEEWEADQQREAEEREARQQATRETNAAYRERWQPLIDQANTALDANLFRISLGDEWTGTESRVELTRHAPTARIERALQGIIELLDAEGEK